MDFIRKTLFRPSHSEASPRAGAVPKQGRPKQLIPRLGGATLLAVLITIAFGFNVMVAQATKVGPQTMPCPNNLPCVSEQKQAISGKVMEHVTQTFAVRFLKGFLAIAGATAVVFIIVGGMQMILGVGNEEAIGKGKKTIIWAVLGLVIVILSVAIVNIITKLFPT